MEHNQQWNKLTISSPPAEWPIAWTIKKCTFYRNWPRLNTNNKKKIFDIKRTKKEPYLIEVQIKKVKLDAFCGQINI